MCIKTAKGVKGFILGAGLNYPPVFFRVYDEEGGFKDYNLLHNDLEIEIICDDAILEEKSEGGNTLDYTHAIRGVKKPL